ncbi:SPFH domain-containing protein [Paenibacillus sp.]|jgi:membrane protease subunit (stomatin/prohibitin family)|uniref:SPFH domain-containing protein n=1 Tax=Paenibacillus sp. TaxID=58172 RepID=UPI00283629C3|nr:SPFH domain-containing protein [Paenibacillus sp.]MDR0269987.1 SPFH domain-containing protein [Paenibacillus sp.]
MAIIDVVKYDGPPGVFAWRYPNQELGTWTQLIVHETQEAILFKGGQALDSFSSGRHTLSTANIPILSNLVNIPFGGKSPFTAEVWFVNKLSSMDVKWGTSSPLELQDPKFNIIVSIRAHGQFGIRIADTRKFLLKLVGTLPAFDQDTLVKYYRGVLMSNIKDMISSYIVRKKISVVEINAYAAEIAKHIEEAIAPAFEDMGISLLNFYIDSINIPTDDPAVQRIKAALAKKAEMDIIGYTYQEERSFNTMEDMAKNPGSSAAAVGSGLGLGLGMAGSMHEAASQMTANLSLQGTTVKDVRQKSCQKCDSLNSEDARFCSGCGHTLTIDPPVNQNKQIICSDCGSPIPPNAKFCENCGDPYNACPTCGNDFAIGTAVCTHCGTQLPKVCRECGELIDAKAKFCPGCGSSCILKCSSCNHEILPGQKFCMECGAKLT